MDIVLNRAMCDYIRATTYEIKPFQYSVWETVPENESGKRGTFQQYKGTRYDHVFHGQTGIGDRTNYLIEVSGQTAHDHYVSILKNGMKPTRIDLQVTVKMPSWWNIREAKDALKHSAWRGHQRDVGLIESDTGTIAVGDRSSDRYIRIYEKGGNTVRFEVEYSHERAEQLGKMILDSNGECIWGVLIAEVDKMPELPIKDLLTEGLGDVDPIALTVPYEKTDAGKRLKWLASLLPTIRQMMRDHDSGDMVRGWFIDLIDVTENERW